MGLEQVIAEDRQMAEILLLLLTIKYNQIIIVITAYVSVYKR